MSKTTWICPYCEEREVSVAFVGTNPYSHEDFVAASCDFANCKEAAKSRVARQAGIATYAVVQTIGT